MNIKTCLLSLLLSTGYAYASPVRAETPTFHNATEVVLFQGGYVDAMAELTAQPTSAVYSFRLMAAVNRSTAMLMASIGSVVGQVYFLGRASAFDALADLAGEP